jgi:hypothetical protein
MNKVLFSGPPNVTNISAVRLRILLKGSRIDRFRS